MRVCVEGGLGKRNHTTKKHGEYKSLSNTLLLADFSVSFFLDFASLAKKKKGRGRRLSDCCLCLTCLSFFVN